MKDYKTRYIGKKFGTLLVTEFSEKKGKDNFFKCKCDCGNEPILRIRVLYSGQQTKCKKCYQGSNSPAWKGVGEISKDFFNRIKISAREKKLQINIDLEYIWKLFLNQKKLCALTGVPIFFAKTYNKKHETTASLDRIDSSKGYIRGNVRWLHKSINHVKSNIPDDLFFFICEKVTKIHRNQLSDEYFLQNCKTLVKCGYKK